MPNSVKKTVVINPIPLQFFGLVPMIQADNPPHAMTAPALKTEFDYYVAHQSELVSKYNGKHIVIVGNQVIGAYNSTLEAIIASQKTHAMGTFLVQKCEDGKENYTQSFHSRVSFA